MMSEPWCNRCVEYLVVSTVSSEKRPFDISAHDKTLESKRKRIKHETRIVMSALFEESVLKSDSSFLSAQQPLPSSSPHLPGSVVEESAVKYRTRSTSVKDSQKERLRTVSRKPMKKLLSCPPEENDEDFSSCFSL